MKAETDKTLSDLTAERDSLKEELNALREKHEKQSEELVRYLLEEFENDPQRIWNTNFFGKSLHELVREGLSNKLMRMPVDAQEKVQETLSKIINEGSGGMICILL